jgi:hypothetical protein
MDCIAHPELMEKIKKNGKAFVRDKYDWNHLIDRFFQLEAELSN